jgi:acyl-CoA synthetase (AMP-forming)/AMP-acid ligase II
VNLAAWIERNARLIPERPGIAVGADPYLTHRQWAARVRSIAGFLRHRLMLGAGERVAIVMANHPTYLEALYGIWHAGLVAVPINSRLHQKEFEYVLGHSSARAVFVSPELAETVAPLVDRCPKLREAIVADDKTWRTLLASNGIDLVARRPEDLAWIFYTSGTTGRPKGACLTHRNLLMCSLSYFADIDPIAPTDAVLHAAPLSHGSGCYGLPHVAKGAVSVIPASGHFDPAEIGTLLSAWQGVSFFAAPTMVTRLIANSAFAAADHRGLKAIIYGGAPMYVEDLKRALKLLGPRLAQVYGQGEAPMTITSVSKAVHADSVHPRWEERIGSAGLPRTDVEVRVVDPDDNDMPLGESGEVVVRGDVVMAGYLDDADASAAALQGGWLHTGDVGSFDADGFLTLRDRVKDMIISGGTNIYPREIEEVLLRHAGVKEVSVIGTPDPDWGENVVAYVVADAGRAVTQAELDALCLGSIARFKRPKAYVFVDELPKNNYGKILKTELRKRFALEHSS